MVLSGHTGLWTEDKKNMIKGMHLFNGYLQVKQIRGVGVGKSQNLW